MEYCRRCARIYRALWDKNAVTPQPFEQPDLPIGYREVFSDCIRHADPAVGSYLSDILVLLQVHDARLRDAVAQTNEGFRRAVDEHSLIVYVFRLGEIYALMGNIFGFARGDEVFEEKKLTWENLQNAYSILNFEIDDIFIDERMNLQAFTKRRLERIEEQT